MKFAICNETFENWPFDQAFALAADSGYTGLEIAPFTINTDARQITDAQRATVRRQADQAGLEILGLHWLLAKTTGYHLTSPDAAVRKATGDYLAELARLCRDLGGSIMVHGSPQQRNLLPGVTQDEAYKYAAEVIQQALPTLEECDVTLAIEPLAPVLTNFMQTAAEGVRLIEMIGSPHVRLHLDCIAMSTEATPIPDLIKRHRDLMVHFHANDPNKLGPGFGDLDFHPIFTALGEIDYRGWVSVEVFDLAPGVERISRESISYMKEVLEDLVE